MKAIVYEKYGSPDVLRMEDIERPIPGDKEVLVKVHAVSINSWDWDTLTGKPFEYRFLFGLLHPKSTKMHGCEIAGVVEKIGEHIKHFQVGDEVFGDIAEDGWGAFAEYACAHENSIVLKPSCMTFEQAACLSHGCPSRKLVHLGIFDLFHERCQRGIFGHRHSLIDSKFMKTQIGVLLAFVSTVFRSRLALRTVSGVINCDMDIREGQVR